MSITGFPLPEPIVDRLRPGERPSPRARGRSRALAVAVAALLGLVGGLLPTSGAALAAAPAEGDLSEDRRQLTYEGGPFTLPNRTDPVLGDGTTLQCVPEASPCDDFALRVSLQPEHAQLNPVVKVDLAANGTSDYDLYVLDAEGETVVVGYNPGGTESVEFEVPGSESSYTVRAVPFSRGAAAYTAQVTLVLDDPNADHDGDGVPDLGDACPGTPPDAPADTTGCSGSEAVVPSDPDRPRVVVADLDTAINPYHEFYYRHPSSVTQELLDELGVDPRNVVRLTRTGDFDKDLAADSGFWSRVERGELYHFAGTNIIATSLAPVGGDVPYLKPTGKNPHGTGTSAAVLAANPDAVVLFVEVEGALGSAESHELAFDTPAVDIVTTSYGLSTGLGLVPLPEYRAFEHSYKGVVGNGKLHFSSGGNGPGVTALRAGAGPWWSIGVSGIEEGSSEGDTALSGNLPDFVSDFTQLLPYCTNCESGTTRVSGTSFSTPRAAGVASRLLLEIRRALAHEGGIREVEGVPVLATSVPRGKGAAAKCATGERRNGKHLAPGQVDKCRSVTNWQVRRALEQAAWVPSTEAYDPGQASSGGIGLPVNPVAPWLQTAWGDLTAEEGKGVVSAARAELGFDGTPRVKPPGFCAFQTAVVRARKAWWDHVAPALPDNPLLTGERPPSSPPTDPFVYC